MNIIWLSKHDDSYFADWGSGYWTYQVHSQPERDQRVRASAIDTDVTVPVRTLPQRNPKSDILFPVRLAEGTARSAVKKLHTPG